MLFNAVIAAALIALPASAQMKKCSRPGMPKPAPNSSSAQVSSVVLSQQQVAAVQTTRRTTTTRVAAPVTTTTPLPTSTSKTSVAAPAQSSVAAAPAKGKSKRGLGWPNSNKVCDGAGQNCVWEANKSDPSVFGDGTGKVSWLYDWGSNRWSSMDSSTYYILLLVRS